MSEYQPKRYDEAVALLRDLKDLAQFQNQKDIFKSRVLDLVRAHSRKPTLVDKINRGAILEGIVKGNSWL
jgi:type II secretory pathway predicted ATPase ExeA